MWRTHFFQRFSFQPCSNTYLFQNDYCQKVPLSTIILATHFTLNCRATHKIYFILSNNYSIQINCFWQRTINQAQYFHAKLTKIILKSSDRKLKLAIISNFCHQSLSLYFPPWFNAKGESRFKPVMTDSDKIIPHTVQRRLSSILCIRHAGYIACSVFASIWETENNIL